MDPEYLWWYRDLGDVLPKAGEMKAAAAKYLRVTEQVSANVAPALHQRAPATIESHELLETAEELGVGLSRCTLVRKTPTWPRISQ